MLKNITSSLPGIAFQLALDTVSPLLGSISSRFHQLAEMVNGQNKNSCSIATALVRNAAEATSLSTNKACQDIAVTLGIASDYADAEQTTPASPNDTTFIAPNSAPAIVYEAALPYSPLAIA